MRRNSSKWMSQGRLPGLTVLLLWLVVSCSPTSAPVATPGPVPRELTPVTLAMGYIPNIQFAPFYVAVEKGYFREEGIDLQLDYGMESDLLKLVGTNELQFVIGSGDQVILARSQGLPVVYVMNWWRKFPVGVVALEDLEKPQDLAGKRVGIPGLYGASFIGWKALAYASSLDESQVRLESIGYTQVESLLTGQVDAAVVYAVNEPVQLERQGKTPHLILVSDYIDLVSNGLITNEQTIAEHPELVRGMVRASVRGLRDTLENPEEAFELSLRHAPEAGGPNRDTQMAVLKSALEFWRSDRLGYSDPAAWEASQRFMKQVGLIQTEVEVSKLFTNEFLP